MKRRTLLTLAAGAVFAPLVPSTVSASPHYAPVFGPMVLDPTFECIGWSWPVVTEDPATPVASVDVAYRENGGPLTAGPTGRFVDWTAQGYGKHWMGSLFDLRPGTSYTVVLAARSPSGATVATASLSISTRAEDLPSHNDLLARATHAIDPNGNDDGPGTLGQPWRTLTKALASAPPGAVVVLSPGYYQRAQTTQPRRQPISIVAQFPSVARFEIDGLLPILTTPIKRTVIYSHLTAPSDSTIAEDQPFRGGWQTVTINGRNLWTRELDVADVQTVSWRIRGARHPLTERASKQTRLAVWESKRGPLTLIPNVAAWVDELYANTSYNWGLYQEPDSRRAYLRLPGDVDPNRCWLWYASGSGTSPIAEVGVNVDAPDCRIYGPSFRGVANGVRVGLASHRTVVSGVLVDCARTPVLLNGTDNDDRAMEDVVVERCYFRSNMVSELQDEDPELLDEYVVPWATVKVGPWDPATGDYYEHAGRRGQKPLGNLENSAVSVRDGVRRFVFRDSRVEGYFGGISGTGDHPTDFDNVDVYRVGMRRIADNGPEPEGIVRNVRIFRVRVEESNTGLASALAGGPIWCRDVVTWDCSNAFLRPIHRGDPDDVYTGGASPWKWGTRDYGVIDEAFCTYWSKRFRRGGEPTDGYEKSNSGDGTVWFSDRVICRVTGVVVDHEPMKRSVSGSLDADERNPSLRAQVDAALPGAANGDLTPVHGSICDGRGARANLRRLPHVAFS